MNIEALPRTLVSGSWPYGHCQGIAVDTKNQFVYYSFTTALIKTDFGGRVIGTVTGLLGHLGCIALCKADGRVYGSLEYKRDAIGMGILEHAGSSAQLQDAFYIAIFDVDKIDRMDMDACTDSVMTTVYLREVYEDYTAAVSHGGRTVLHRHGCSGIDGVTFGRMPGERSGPQMLFVAYGVYSDTERSDNDDQVLLAYDPADWQRFAQPLHQHNMHRCGPQKPDAKLFVRTGNTRYGVQNLEYDPDTGNLFMAVYRGEKPCWPNYDLYVIDGSKAPQGNRLSLLSAAAQEETPGWRFAYGATGLCALGDGYFYISQDGAHDGLYHTQAVLYRWDGQHPFIRV